MVLLTPLRIVPPVIKKLNTLYTCDTQTHTHTPSHTHTHPYTHISPKMQCDNIAMFKTNAYRPHINECCQKNNNGFYLEP
jgi:hypothetical protein